MTTLYTLLYSLSSAQSLTYRPPPSVNSVSDILAWNASKPRPLSERVRFAIKLYDSIVPLIPSLFYASRPPTILLDIMSIIIYAFYRGLLFSVFGYMREIRFVHIISELFKRFPETSDTAPTIIFVLRTFGIGYARLHFSPYSVKSCMGLPMSLTFLSVLYSKTTTRFCILRQQAASNYRLHISTIASTLVGRFSRFFPSMSMNYFYNDQTPYPFSNQILVIRYSTHGLILSML